MKTLVTTALGILVLAAPLATAQSTKGLKGRALIEAVQRAERQRAAEREAFARSPEGMRQEIARLKAQQAELQRQQQNARVQARLQQQEREAEEDARFHRENQQKWQRQVEQLQSGR